jgi:hypothetical protein
MCPAAYSSSIAYSLQPTAYCIVYPLCKGVRGKGVLGPGSLVCARARAHCWRMQCKTVFCSVDSDIYANY